MGVKKAEEIPDQEKRSLDELIRSVLMIRPVSVKKLEDGTVDPGKFGNVTYICDVEVITGDFAGESYSGKYVSGVWLGKHLEKELGTGDWVVGKLVARGKGKDLHAATAAEMKAVEKRYEQMAAGSQGSKEVGGGDEPPF